MMDFAKISVLPFICILLLDSGAHAQGPPLPTGTCLAYKKVATTSKTVIALTTIDPLKPGFVAQPDKQAITSGLNGKLMLPGKTSWIPQCDTAGTYTLLQIKANGDQFCVNPQTGAIAFDTTGVCGVEKPYFCGCFAEQQRVQSERLRGLINPICDEHTGYYKPRQIIANSSPGNVCVSPNGTRVSDPFMVGQCVTSVVFVPETKG